MFAPAGNSEPPNGTGQQPTDRPVSTHKLEGMLTFAEDEEAEWAYFATIEENTAPEQLHQRMLMIKANPGGSPVAAVRPLLDKCKQLLLEVSTGRQDIVLDISECTFSCHVNTILNNYNYSYYYNYYVTVIVIYNTHCTS